MLNESWKKIPGHANYEASCHGRIRNATTKKVIKSVPNTKGYHHLNLTGKTVDAHVVVAKAFHGEPPEGHQVDHKDGNNQNNRPDNLEYVTNLENARRAKERGRKYRKPSKAQILGMRTLHQYGIFTYNQLGYAFGTSGQLVSYIINKKQEPGMWCLGGGI